MESSGSVPGGPPSAPVVSDMQAWARTQDRGVLVTNGTDFAGPSGNLACVPHGNRR
jgi:hypothetical protein